ncbi:endonuclease domain-containing protein [Propionicimonas paludicola]|uniref:endonuclease domain-containing protein n=1 Tax=Propionicimonas paludicola TaxID=185243 RepID=UPI00117A19BA|nr:DUF559 domain-containing protein [Propionicimonas paludicola]
MHPQVAAILAERGAISTAEFPRLSSTLARLSRAGLLANPLPGVFVPADDSSPLCRLRAATAWSAPSGVIHGRSAAALWLGEPLPPILEVAHPSLRSRAGVVVRQQRITSPFVEVRSGIRSVTPAYAAVELAATDDGQACCEVLRRGLATPADLEAALADLRGSRGQVVRRRVVTAAAANPWSFAELRLHRMLQSAGITDWVANSPIRVGGQLLVPDIRFRRTRLVLEFDGRSSHLGSTQFLADRERQNLLEAAGYRVLRFGWEHLDHPEYVVPLVRQALRAT